MSEPDVHGPSLDAVMKAIAARLKTIRGLRVADAPPSQINPPQAVVMVPAVSQYQQGLQGRRPRLRPTVLVLVSATLEQAGQLKLAAYAAPTGARSIPAVIADDRTLGGVVNDCLVVSFEPLPLQEVGVIGYFGGRFTLDVLV